MTRWIRRILLCCLTLLACPAWGQIVWEKTWGGPYDDGCEVRNTRDGGMIVMGSFQGTDSWLLRLDANGDTLWTTRITQPYDLCAIAETWDGGFVTAGLTRTPHRDIVAWKFDLRGDSLWRRTYVDSTHTEGMYSLAQLADSSFIIGGYTSANNYDMFAIHIDSLGNELWRHAYGTPGFEGGTTPAPTADSGYVFATTGGINNFSNIWVVRVDAQGDTIWSRNVVEPYQTGGAIPSVMPDGKILVMGWIAQGNDYDNYLLCLDAQGNVRWSKRYYGIGFESRTARGVIADRFGGYTFVSSVDLSYGPSGPDFDIAIFRTDTLGNVLEIRRIGHAGDDMPRYFEQAPNGDYLVLGYSTSFVPNGQQMYLARLATAGCTEYFYDLSGPNRRTVCPGDSVVLDAGAGFAQYLWSDGFTTQTRLAQQNDTLYVQATDSSGCMHFSSAVVVDVQTGPQFTWTASGNLTVQLDGMLGDGAQPQWDFGDGSFASTLDTAHTYVQAGTYFVCLQAQVPGCGLESFCDSVTVSSTIGMQGTDNHFIKVFPNPTHGPIWMQNPSDTESKLRILDNQGRILFMGDLGAQSKQYYDATDWANGLYLIELVGEDGRIQTIRMIIAR